MGSSPAFLTEIQKERRKASLFVFGADDRTRTCTLARWNLNPMSLPIPPHPHVEIFYHEAFSLSMVAFRTKE